MAIGQHRFYYERRNKVSLVYVCILLPQVCLSIDTYRVLWWRDILTLLQCFTFDYNCFKYFLDFYRTRTK